MRQISVYFILFSLITTSSCKRTFQYSLLEVRPTVKNLNNTALKKISNLSPKDTFSFLLISDTQVSYDQLEDFVIHANKTYLLDSIAFVLHGGDYTDYGASFEYNMYYEDIKHLNFPIVGTIGNHDMLANGDKQYALMFGEEDFSFNYGNYKFIVFNSNSREVNFGGQLPRLDWLSNQIEESEQEHIFYLSHVSPMSTDYDPTLIEGYTNLIANSPKSRLSIHGHTHSYEYYQPFGDNIDYVVIPTMMKREYVKIDVKGSKTSVNKITY